MRLYNQSPNDNSKIKANVLSVCRIACSFQHCFVLFNCAIKELRVREESFVNLYFQPGYCRIYSISDFESDGGDITQSERTNEVRRILCNSIPFADILSREAEIFAEHIVIRLYSGIGKMLV